MVDDYNQTVYQTSTGNKYTINPSSHIQVAEYRIHAAFFGAWMSRGVHARGETLTLVHAVVPWRVDVAWRVERVERG